MEMKQEKQRMENFISILKIKCEKAACKGSFFYIYTYSFPRQIKQISLKNCILPSTLIDRLSHRACFILMKQEGEQRDARKKGVRCENLFRCHLAVKLLF